MRVENLTNSPFDLIAEGGRRVRLPAFGSVEGEFSDDYLDLLRASNAVRVVESGQSADQGGLDRLRQDAEGLGIEVDRRWGERRLQAEIDKALSA